MSDFLFYHSWSLVRLTRFIVRGPVTQNSVLKHGYLLCLFFLWLRPLSTVSSAQVTARIRLNAEQSLLSTKERAGLKARPQPADPLSVGMKAGSEPFSELSGPLQHLSVVIVSE